MINEARCNEIESEAELLGQTCGTVAGRNDGTGDYNRCDFQYDVMFFDKRVTHFTIFCDIFIANAEFVK